MDVGTNIKPRLQGRHKAAGLHWPFMAGNVPSHHVSRHHEIFKKTPFVSGLHPVSRDVVKDIAEIASIPLLTMTALHPEAPQGSADACWMIAENPAAVTPHSHQDGLRSADEHSAASGDVVGVTGNQAIDVLFTVTSFGAGISNGKLTDRGWDARKSKRTACATNAASGLHTSVVERDRFASAGASLSGGDLEKHSYADI
ncbi:hypothetical protein [Tardiphaga sp.]|jgi:hypothetical protein|uniref:hypothetical protein n=1 Tax=Tardiphaga sp. TaxID=1926292 RepID=UPI0037DA5563